MTYCTVALDRGLELCIQYGAMLKGSASQGRKEQRKTESAEKSRAEEKHRKASQGRKDRSTLRERQQETQEEKKTVSQKSCQAV